MAYNTPPTFVAGNALTAAQMNILGDDIVYLNAQIPTTLLTTRGDILYRNATIPARLAIGASGRYLRSDGTDPSWAVPLFADLGYSGLTAGQYVRASGATAAGFAALLFSDLTYSGLTTGQVPRATGATTVAFGAVDLANANAVTGVLPVARGGNGVAAVPSFSVDRNSSDQTGFTTSSWIKVLWTREVFDSNSNFASSTFTPTVAGKYLLVASLIFIGGASTFQAGERLICGIWKNGAAHRYGQTVASGTDYQGAQISVIVEANGSTDAFEVYFYHTGANSLTLSGDTGATHFSGVWVGP